MDYKGRLDRLHRAMAASGIDLVFLPISADLQYLTGIPRDMPNYGLTIYNGRWLEGALIGPDSGPLLVLPRMTDEFHFEGLIGGEKRVIGDQDEPLLVAREVLTRFHFGKNPRVAIGATAQAETIIRLQDLIPNVQWSDAADLMRPLRRIKDSEEIAMMREAGAVTESAFADVLKQLKHGMTENEIKSEVDLQLRRHGALGPSFVTAMYNNGPNHHLGRGHANTLQNTPLQPPVALLFDFGAAYKGFCYDYGRTVFFGEPDAEMQRIFATIMGSQAAGIKALRAGATTCEAVDRVARQVVETAGYGPYFRHRLGHGIGMDVHEPPFLAAGNMTPVEENMAFTIEPSIIVPGGFAARVEDIIIAHPDGGEPLTRGFQTLQVVS